MDTVAKEKRSAIMRRVKSNETSLEIKLRKRLWKEGLRYRKNDASLFAKPDISNKSKRIVVFIDSCFWHGCGEHLRMPKSNVDYWIHKIDKDKKRDHVVNLFYRKKGWKVLRIWEHQLKLQPEETIDTILNVFNLIKQQS
jgi:DNA mismatch endonuclease, patch repair protein